MRGNRMCQCLGLEKASILISQLPLSQTSSIPILLSVALMGQISSNLSTELTHFLPPRYFTVHPDQFSHSKCVGSTFLQITGTSEAHCIV
jgi:hypothetical protein